MKYILNEVHTKVHHNNHMSDMIHSYVYSFTRIWRLLRLHAFTIYAVETWEILHYGHHLEVSSTILQHSVNTKSNASLFLFTMCLRLQYEHIQIYVSSLESWTKFILKQVVTYTWCRRKMYIMHVMQKENYILHRPLLCTCNSSSLYVRIRNYANKGLFTCTNPINRRNNQLR